METSQWPQGLFFPTHRPTQGPMVWTAPAVPCWPNPWSETWAPWPHQGTTVDGRNIATVDKYDMEL